MPPVAWALLVSLGFLLLGYVVGQFLESRHFDSIRKREGEMASLKTVSFVPPGWQVGDASLVEGSVVVSLDYFKRFMASLRTLIGGRMRTLEPLLERGRREAMLRMKQQAISGGYDAVINVRLVTSRLANAKGDMKGTVGVEVLAYGTAVKRS